MVRARESGVGQGKPGGPWASYLSFITYVPNPNASELQEKREELGGHAKGPQCSLTSLQLCHLLKARAHGPRQAAVLIPLLCSGSRVPDSGTWT